MEVIGFDGVIWSDGCDFVVFGCLCDFGGCEDWYIGCCV